MIQGLEKIKAKHYQPLIIDEKFWETEDEKYLDNCGERLCLDRAKAIFNTMEGETVLDVGCNIGFFCFFGNNRGFKMTGIENDIHEKVKGFSGLSSIQTAKKLTRIYKKRPKFIDGDYIQYIKENSFDNILYLSVWHHHLLGYGHTDFQKMSKTEAEQVFIDVWNATKKALYFETDGHIKQLVENGWGEDKVLDNLQRLTGRIPKLIHESPDGWAKPRKTYKISK